MSERPRQSAESEFGRFFLPGPTEVRPEVLSALDRPVMGHRGREMVELMGRVQPGLQEAFGTDRPVYVSTSSATGLMEAAVANLSRERVLCLVGGAFGRRFREIAAALGRETDALEVEWGEAHAPRELRDWLQASPGRYDLVTAVHSETSTGVLNPIGELADVVEEFDEVLFAVDAVSAVGGVPVAFDEWGVDFMIAGSQKALALPPGLAFGVASEEALARAEKVRGRGYYFDVLDFERRIENGQTPNTPAVHLIYALERQLERIRDAGGFRARWDRHAAMAQRTHRWVSGLHRRRDPDFGVLAAEGHRSPTVTAVELPARQSGPEVCRELRERGYTIAPGYGELKERTVRIGHMGDHTPEELGGLLDETEAVL